MKKSLIKNLSISLACLLGIGGMAGVALTSNNEITKVEAAAPAATINNTTIYNNTGSSSYSTYGDWSWTRNGNSSIGSNYIEVGKGNYSPDNSIIFSYYFPDETKVYNVVVSATTSWVGSSDDDSQYYARVGVNADAKRYVDYVSGGEVNFDLTKSPYTGAAVNAVYIDFYVDVSDPPHDKIRISNLTITIYTAPMTVTFDMNGQGTAPDAQSIGYGGKVAKPTNPTAGGFTFGGWYKDANCTEAWNFNTDKVTEDTTIYAKWTMGTGLWVGDNYIPATASLSGEGWSYDLDTNTLTLDGFTYSGKGHKYNGDGGWRADHAVIYYEGEETLNLVLSGENVITNTFAGDDSNTWVYGIFANKALNISGEGSLTISMTGSKVRESYGIYSVNGMTINGGILNVTAGTTTFNSCAFRAQSGQIIINGGTIEAHGGLSDYNYSNALDCFGGYDDKTKIGLQINSLNTLVATGESQAINFALDTTCAGTGWTNVEGTEGEATIAVGHYQDSGVTSFKKVEFVGATLVTIEIANKEINYNEDAPTYTYVAKIDDVTVTDENLLSAIATKLTIGSSYTKGSDAGEYDIVNSNASYNEKFNVSGEDYMISSVVKGTLTVKKIDAVVTAPTAKTDLHYTGEAQKLINAGSTTGGTLQYSLDGVNYSEEIPEATNVDEYTIYYKVVGDTNYKDVEVKSFKVSILENDKVTLNSVIDSVETYYNSIKDGHPTVASDLLDAINAAKAVKDNANKTIQEIENAANTLTNALKAAEVEVAKNLITAIGEVELTQDCKDKIDVARAAYDALPDKQKALVNNYSVLTDAEAQYTALDNQNKADAVKALINSIGNVEYTQECKDKIDAAKEAYEALTDTQKALVDNHQSLVDADAAYKALDDAAKADAVKDLINAIGTVTLDSEDVITEARTAYNALTSEQKALVTNYQTLVDAEARLAELKTAKTNADEVVSLINQIGEVSYPNSGDAIKAARDAYNALTTDDERGFVSNYQTLLDAEATYNNQKQAGADAVINLINGIGNVEYTQESKDKIDAAREAYDALTEAQKDLVTNKKVLFGAIDLYNTLAHQPEVNDNGVAVEGKDGELIPVNVNVKVEVKTTVQAQEGTTEYQKIQEMLASNEQISGVYDVKLVQTIGGVETVIQPSDIKEGMIIIVEITLPDGLNVEGLKILHIHSENDITFVENFTINGNKVTFETDRLSEFAFVTQKANVNTGLSGWAIALIVIGSLLLVLCGAYFLLFFVFNKWIKVGDKAVRVMRFALGTKDDKQRYLAFPCKFAYRNKEKVFNTKEDTLK